MSKTIQALAAVVILILIQACGHGGKTVPPPTDKPISMVTVEEHKMKDVNINEAYFDSAVKKARVLSEEEVKKLQVEKLTESGVDEATAKFKILDTLLSTDKGNVILVAHETENEHYAWVAAYNAAGSYLNKTEVFYRDYVEYLLNRDSEIRDNKIHVKLTTGGESSNSITLHYFLNAQQSIEKGK